MCVGETHSSYKFYLSLQIICVIIFYVHIFQQSCQQPLFFLLTIRNVGVSAFRRTKKKRNPYPFYVTHKKRMGLVYFVLFTPFSFLFYSFFFHSLPRSGNNNKNAKSCGKKKHLPFLPVVCTFRKAINFLLSPPTPYSWSCSRTVHAPFPKKEW